MPDDRRRDGSKPSFSERDKRGRERGERRDGGARGPRRDHGPGQKSYRAALEQAFESGKVDELVATLNKVKPRPPTPPPVEPTPAPSATPSPGPAKRTTGKPAASKRAQLIAKIRGAEDSVELTAAIDRFLAEFPELPYDYEVLEKALGHRKSEVVVRVLQQLEVAIARAKPRRSRSLLMKLALLEENHDDDDICALAAKLRATL